jgi:hypothetical protein
VEDTGGWGQEGLEGFESLENASRLNLTYLLKLTNFFSLPLPPIKKATRTREK